MGGVLEAAGAYLVRRYQPEAVPWFPGDPSRNFPLWRHLMATGAAFLAEDPNPAGFAAAVVRDGVWLLSALWVTPDRHGEGIGSALLDEALAWGRGASTFSVVSSPDPSAQTLYLRRSMFPVWTQHEFSGESRDRPEMPEGIAPLTEHDQPWVDEIDREVRGHARPEDHGFWRRRAKGLALRREGRPIGYVYVSSGGRVGPGGAENPGDVRLLIQAGRAVAPGPTTLILPSGNWTALKEATRLRLTLIASTAFMASRPLPGGDRYISSGGALG